MATAKKLPSGQWRVLQFVGYDENGKRKYKSFTAATKKEAEYAAAEYVLLNKDTSGTNMTVYQAIDRYIASKEHILSPSTIQGYNVIRRNRLKSIGNIKLSALTKVMVQEAINQEASRLSPKSTQNTYGLLSAALKQHNIEFTISLPGKRKKEINIPTKDELDLILSQPMPDDVRLAIILASCMGLRRSEICALKVKDIDVKNKIITVDKAYVKNKDKQYVLKETKTYSGTRQIPMPKKVIDELQSYPMHDPLFKRSPDAIGKQFMVLVRKTLGKNIRFHDLRHYYASVLLRLGVPDKYAMDLMGHSSNNMLKTVYQHTMEDKKQEIADTLNKFF